MKKYLVHISYLLLPCILLGVGFLLVISFNPLFLVVLYLVTAMGIFFFFFQKYYRDKMKILALLLGLIISPLFPLIPEAHTYYLDVVVLDGPWLQFHFFTTSLILWFYVLPFTFISLIAIIILKTMDKKNEVHIESEIKKGNMKQGSNQRHNEKKNNKKKQKKGNKKK